MGSPVLFCFTRFADSGNIVESKALAFKKRLQADLVDGAQFASR